MQKTIEQKGHHAVSVVCDLGRDIQLMALDQALDSLSSMDPRKGRLVELHCFGGLTIDESAEVLGVSPETAKRDWKMAKNCFH